MASFLPGADDHQESVATHTSPLAATMVLPPVVDKNAEAATVSF